MEVEQMCRMARWRPSGPRGRLAVYLLVGLAALAPSAARAQAVVGRVLLEGKQPVIGASVTLVDDAFVTV
ncbi:MAG: hypothetical protein D6701_06165, partial [Gemmatimonadetes bacterium]